MLDRHTFTKSYASVFLNEDVENNLASIKINYPAIPLSGQPDLVRRYL
jgi:hypothetical protein